MINHSDDMFAPVGLLRIVKCHTEPKVQRTSPINGTINGSIAEDGAEAAREGIKRTEARAKIAVCEIFDACEMPCFNVSGFFERRRDSLPHPLPVPHSLSFAAGIDDARGTLRMPQCHDHFCDGGGGGGEAILFVPFFVCSFVIFFRRQKKTSINLLSERIDPSPPCTSLTRVQRGVNTIQSFKVNAPYRMPCDPWRINLSSSACRVLKPFGRMASFIPALPLESTAIVSITLTSPPPPLHGSIFTLLFRILGGNGFPPHEIYPWSPWAFQGIRVSGVFTRPSPGA